MSGDPVKTQQNDLKREYDSCCDTLECFSKDIKNITLAEELGKKMEQLFFKLECSAADSHSLYDTDAHDVGKWFADTCYDSMITLVSYVELMKLIEFDRYFIPSQKSLASMQSLVRLFLERKQVIELRKLLSDNSITTIGLDEKRIFRMTKSVERGLVYLFGVVFLSVIVISAFFIPYPSDYQYEVFRITLALSGAGLATFFSGFLTVELPGKIKAGSGFAVFIIIYYFAPVAL
ncbi:hypothetical protein [Plesiomonas sp. ZOR0011]|uniref:hypothetical protein n=1 Tax=Plesiomonas sp. ZOR0011 TaxID=1339230 RepID=UPI0006458B8E|nr:hypothetical protein [Plesiomonas sp. ZOR0011]